ncbi:MAG: hypothetical protein JJ693_07085 [Acidithiobacillus sp.]|nr:hypothetical protein [Acidithiobacillus sp.]
MKAQFAKQEFNVAFYQQIIARVELKAAAGQLDGNDLRAINALLGKEGKPKDASVGS